MSSVSESPQPLQLVMGFVKCHEIAVDKPDQLSIADSKGIGSRYATGTSCFISRDRQLEWNELNASWKKRTPNPFAEAPDASSVAFLKELADLLATIQNIKPLNLADLQLLEKGFEATHFHTKVPEGKFQAVWVSFRFEAGRLFLSSRAKAYGVNIDDFQDSDSSQTWPCRLEEKGIEEKVQFLQLLHVAFLQFDKTDMLRRALLLREKKQYAVLAFKSKQSLELCTQCLDLLVKKCPYAKLRKKFEVQNKKAPRQLAENEEELL